jgi:hypothetical protein
MAASLLVTGTVILTVGLLIWTLLSRYLVEQSALKSVEHQARSTLQVWELYSKVVRHAEDGSHVHGTPQFELTTNMMPRGELWYLGKKKESTPVPTPATFIILLGQKLKLAGEDLHDNEQESRTLTRHRVYSEYPFRDRGQESPPRDSFGRTALEKLKGKPDKPSYHAFETRPDGRVVLRFAYAVPISSGCIKCHGKASEYDKDYYRERKTAPRTDWEPGETRGVLEIIRPMDEDYRQTRWALLAAYAGLIVGTVVLLGACQIVLRVGRWRRGW